MNGHATIARAVRFLATSLCIAVFLALLPAPTRESNAMAKRQPASVPAFGKADLVAKPSPSAASAHGSVGTAGMIVAIDPETGQLGMPTREQREELSRIEAARRAAPAVTFVEEHRPDGSVHVDLKGQFQDYATVQIRPDGSKLFRCVDDSLTAMRVSKDAPPAVPALEVR